MAIAVAGSCASADIFFSASNKLDVTVIETTPNRYQITVEYNSLTAGSAGIQIWGDDPNDIIDSITTISDTTHELDMILLNISEPGEGSPQTSIGAVRNISHIVPGGDAGGTLRVSVISITGDLGTPTSNSVIEANEINQLRIGGDVYSRVIANGPYGTTGNFVEIAGDWVKGGYYRGDPFVNSIVVDGTLGSGSSTVEIFTDGDIDLLRAGSIGNAAIGVNSEGFSGTTSVGTLETLLGGFTSNSASVLGSLDLLRVAGDFDADLTINSALPAAERWGIGGSLLAGGVIDLPTSGLAGNIVVNAADGSGTWDGDVLVGAATLADEYATISASLGGGAVGVVPFATHGEDSSPASGSTFGLSPNIQNPPVFDEMNVRWYGEIQAAGVAQVGGPYVDAAAADAGGMPVIVEVWRDAGPCSNQLIQTDCDCNDDLWADVSHQWEWEVLNNDRLVRLVRGHALTPIQSLTPEVTGPVGPVPIGPIGNVSRPMRDVYRVRPRVDVNGDTLLRSVLPGGGTADVAVPSVSNSYWNCPLDGNYRVIVAEDLSGLRALDLTANGGVGLEDTVEWLFSPVDLDGSGEADIEDLAHILHNSN